MGRDPVVSMKARKNATELEGARNAHLRDGAAMVRFLHWVAIHAPGGNLSEIDAAAALETFRRATGKLKDISFPSIAAANANAAIPHYRVTTKTNAKIRRDDISASTLLMTGGRPPCFWRKSGDAVAATCLAIRRALGPVRSARMSRHRLDVANRETIGCPAH